MGRAQSYLGRYLPESTFDPIGKPEVDRVKALEGDVEKLSVLLRALLDQLSANKTISPDHLKAMVHQIDMADGTADGTSLRVPMGRPGELKKKKK